MSRNRVIVLAWIVLGAVTAVLVVEKYRAAVAGDPTDGSLGVFIDAARRAADGGDVYDAVAVNGEFLTMSYTYSPLVAWLLVPLLGTGLIGQIWTAFCLACGLAAIAAVVALLWRRLGPWQRVGVAAVAVVTLDYNELVSWELLDGQSQLPVLATTALAVLFAARAPIASGAMLAVGALVKTWPAAFGLWIFRRGNPRRWRELAGLLGTAAVFAVVMAIAAGPGSLVEMVRRTLALSEQPLPVYSAWFFERELFADSPTPVPSAQTPVLGRVVTWLVVAAIVAGIVLVLRRPGDDSLAMWNLASGVILLLPVSHQLYHLLMLPLLWHWLGIALAERTRVGSWAVVGIAGVWWLVSFRIATSDVGLVHSLATVVLALALFGASTIEAARRDPLGLRLRLRRVGAGAGDAAPGLGRLGGEQAG